MVVPLACTYCRQKTELLGFSLAGGWVLTVVWCVMLNPLAFNYKIHIQKIPERGREEEKKKAISVLMVTKFLVIFCFASPERWRSGDLATGSLLCCGTEGHGVVMDLAVLGLWLDSLLEVFSNLNDAMILCLWTIRSFFEKALLLFLLFLSILTNVYFLVYLSWAIFIFTFMFT